MSRHIRDERNSKQSDRPVSVIPCGVAVPVTPTEFRREPFRVVFSGRIRDHQQRALLVVQTWIRACRSKDSLRATLIGDGYARAACEQQVAEDPDLWQRCSTASRSLVAQRYRADGSYRQWRQLLEGLDQQSADNLPSLYPIHNRRIFGLRRIDRQLHRQSRTPSSRITTLRQTLRTTIARVKHRIKTALGRPA